MGQAAAVGVERASLRQEDGVLPALGIGELYLVSWRERAAALTDHARQSSRGTACPRRVRDGSELDTGERVVKIAGRQHAVDLP
jgi:hypothetical protein